MKRSFGSVTTPTRYLATSALQQPRPGDIFDRSVKLIQRERGAFSNKSDQVEYLRDEVARKTIERLAFIRKDLRSIVDLGSGSGNFAKALYERKGDKDTKFVRDKIHKITMIDNSSDILNKWSNHPFNSSSKIERISADEETLSRTISPLSQDAIISNLSLHWINDLPGVLTQIQSTLKPNGFFMGSLFCEDTLFELRTSLQIAELERKGGLTPGRVSPLVRVNDITSLLKKAGFEMVTIDVEEIVVGYPDIVAVVEDLQLMGEQNANLLSAGGPLSKELILSAQAIFQALHGETDKTGRTILPLTFRVLFMIGWKPDIRSNDVIDKTYSPHQ